MLPDLTQETFAYRICGIYFRVFNSKMPEYWTKASAMPALQTIKKPKVLLQVEVMTVAAAVPEAVVLEKMEMVALDKNTLIHSKI